MAWRPTEYLIEGELDNTVAGKVTGWMRFAGMKDKVTFDLQGDFHRDIRGAKIRLTHEYPGRERKAASEMEGFCQHQAGKAGDITAGLPPKDYVDYPYIEWYGDGNGRVVIELDASQVKVIGSPIPALESFPISREAQMGNMGEFLSAVAQDVGIPSGSAICVGEPATRPARHANSTAAGGMELVPQGVREKLPPLYAQEELGGRAVAHVKYFTPDGSWTWYATEFDGKDTFFGLVDGHVKELGYFSLSELREACGPMGLHIERDLHWKPTTLQEIAPEVFAETKDGGEQ
jgi:hypothetical protein